MHAYLVGAVVFQKETQGILYLLHFCLDNSALGLMHDGDLSKDVTPQEGVDYEEYGVANSFRGVVSADVAVPDCGGCGGSSSSSSSIAMVIKKHH